MFNLPRLRRPRQCVEPRLQCCNACVLHCDPRLRRGKLLGQRLDQRVLLGVAQFAEVGELGRPAFGIEPTATVSRIIDAGAPGSCASEPIARPAGAGYPW
jgi:hypothetical protein